MVTIDAPAWVLLPLSRFPLSVMQIQGFDVMSDSIGRSLIQTDILQYYHKQK